MRLRAFRVNDQMRLEQIDFDGSDLKDERGKLAFKEGDIPLAAQLLAGTQKGDQLAGGPRLHCPASRTRHGSHQAVRKDTRRMRRCLHLLHHPCRPGTGPKCQHFPRAQRRT